MKKLMTALGTVATAVAFLALPTVATAEYLVPPGNSAGNQYTEALPTAGGDKDASKGPKGGHRSPNAVLGTHRAHRLDSQGPDGEAAAELAAATAPVTSAAPEPAPTHDGQPAPREGGGNGGGGAPSHRGGDGATTGGGPEPNGKAGGEPGGSSGFGEVVSQATGSSSGKMGLLLPLIVVGALAWSIAYLARQRKRPTA
jgi:hypothetical protein